MLSNNYQSWSVNFVEMHIEGRRAESEKGREEDAPADEKICWTLSFM